MTKPVRKRIIIPMILTICLAAFAALFIACNNTPPATDPGVTYTVTVSTDQGPASGVGVAVKKGNAAIGSVQTTGADGKVTLTLPSDEYTVELSKLPEHYELPENANVKLTASNPDLTITLAQKFAYVVNLVTTGNKPFYAENVQVGICTLDGNCRTPVALESGGVARIEEPKGNYHTQVLGLDGYVYECDENGYYTGKNFSATDTEMTITVYPAVELAKGAPLTDAQKTASAYAGFYENHEACPAYEYELQLTANDVKYYKLTAEMSGKYYIYSSSYDIRLYNDGKEFSLEVDESNAVNGLQYSYYVELEAEKTYYFKTKADAELQADKATLAVVAPIASYVSLGNLAGDVTQSVTVNSAAAVAVIAVKPASGAAYKATAQGDTLVKLDCVKSEPASTATPTQDGYKAQAEAAAKLTSRYAGQYTLYFTVQVKADKYPATAKIKVEKTATLTDETTVVKVTETLTKQTAPENKELAPLPMTADATIEKQGGIYYYNGNKVMVNITESAPSRYSAALAYMDQDETRISYVIIESNDDLTKGDKYTDYREFIRGFKDYDETPSMQGTERTIPETLTEQNCYANYVDENGCYPLTEELKVFLEQIYELNSTSLSNMPGETGYKWRFPCYYYDDAIEADIVVGKYEQAMGMDVTTLTVNADGTFVIAESMGSKTGNWVKTAENAYTFTEHNATFGDIPYTVTRDAQSGQLVFMDGENEAYTFNVVNNDPESEPTDIYQNKTAKLELYADSDSTGKYKFYMYDKALDDLVEFATGTYTMGKPITLTYDDPTALGGATVSVVYDEETDTMTVTITPTEGEPQTLILRHA